MTPFLDHKHHAQPVLIRKMTIKETVKAAYNNLCLNLFLAHSSLSNYYARQGGIQVK